MKQIFGEFNEESIRNVENISFQLISGSGSAKQEWKKNGLLADLLADFLSGYWSNFFNENGKIHTKPLKKQKEIVSFVANELLENATKYSYKNSDYSVNIQFYVYSEYFVLCINNSVSPNQVANFQAFIQKLLYDDLEQLYLQQIMQEEDIQNTTSGLVHCQGCIDG